MLIIVAILLFVLIYFGSFDNWILQDTTGSFAAATQAMADNPDTNWLGLGLVVLVMILLTVAWVAVELFRRKIETEEYRL